MKAVTLAIGFSIVAVPAVAQIQPFQSTITPFHPIPFTPVPMPQPLAQPQLLPSTPYVPQAQPYIPPPLPYYQSNVPNFNYPYNR